MKTYIHEKLRFWGRLALFLLAAVVVAACGGNDPTPEPTATVVPTVAPTVAPTTAPTATTAPVVEESATVTTTEEASSAQEAQPESPLSQPASPLTTAVIAPVTVEEAIALAEVTTAPEPAAGFGSIAGVLYSIGSVPGAIRGVQVYLEAADEIEGKYFPRAISLGPDEEKGDFILEYNDNGQVAIEVPPGHYHMSVWTIYGWNLVMESPEDESQRLITVEEGDQLDLGVLYVKWP